MMPCQRLYAAAYVYADFRRRATADAERDRDRLLADRHECRHTLIIDRHAARDVIAAEMPTFPAPLILLLL